MLCSLLPDMLDHDCDLKWLALVLQLPVRCCWLICDVIVLHFACCCVSAVVKHSFCA